MSSTLAHTLVIAEMQARDLLRRRAVMILFVLLPAAFYYSVPAEADFSLLAGAIGVSWAVAAAGLFGILGWRRADPRLALAGASAYQELAGRLLSEYRAIVLAGVGNIAEPTAQSLSVKPVFVAVIVYSDVPLSPANRVKYMLSYYFSRPGLASVAPTHLNVALRSLGPWLAGGAPFLLKLADLAKANMAFAVGLMVVLMVITVGYMPIVLPLLLAGVSVGYVADVELRRDGIPRPITTRSDATNYSLQRAACSVGY